MEKWCVLVMGLSLTACGATIEPGHRGLLFNPRDGGLQNKVLEPGRHYTGFFGRIDDFDVTYSTRKEEMNTVSQEGLHLTIAVSAIFIGQNRDRQQVHFLWATVESPMWLLLAAMLVVGVVVGLLLRRRRR